MRRSTRRRADQDAREETEALRKSREGAEKELLSCIYSPTS